jgi:outer membrane protein TolC
VTGNLDLAGRLRATLRRNVALLEAARAGTEASRRELILAVNEAYYGLSLAAARRQSAELDLTAAEESERAAQLKFDAGKAARVDVLRARVHKAARRDKLEQARAAEAVAGDSLRILIGYDFTTPISTTDLITALLDITELNRFTAEWISCRPELAQLDAQLRAAQQEVRVARAGRLPQLSYYINGGVDTDSLGPSRLRDHTGVLAAVSLTIPLFDWGANRSRERQATLRALSLESQRALALRSLTQEFYAALTQALSAASRAEILQTSVADAERNIQMSIERYRAGETQLDEVTEAQTALAATRVALYQALFDYQISRRRLAQAACQ